MTPCHSQKNSQNFKQGIVVPGNSPDGHISHCGFDFRGTTNSFYLDHADHVQQKHIQ